MRLVRTGLEFRMELYADEPRMARQFYDFHQLAIWRNTSQLQAAFCELTAECVVQFKPVTMAFINQFFAINRANLCTIGQLTRIQTQPHRTTEVGNILLVFHDVDDILCAFRQEFCGVCIRQTSTVPCKFYNCHLHTQTDTKHRNLIFSCIFNCGNHSFDTTVAETARNDDTIAVL